MGVDSSTPLPPHFKDITKWSKEKVNAAIKIYIDGDYDFGIDYKVVMHITGYDEKHAKDLINAHSKNNSGIINAVTLLISIISLGNAENRNEVGRLGAIFDLMDFSHNSQISLDELTILLMSITNSYSFILQKTQSTTVIEQRMREKLIINFSQHIYDMLDKKKTSHITKNELIQWTKNNYFTEGVTNISDILKYLCEIPLLVSTSSSISIENSVKDDTGKDINDVHNEKNEDDDN